MKCEVVAVTQGYGKLEGKSGQEIISYTARVSNPNNQLQFDTAAGLLKYCIKHQHWSIFEQADMTIEVNTTRAIAQQILRHRSFTFQEFSQRYASTNLLGEISLPELRRQDKKNRQNSTDDLDEFAKQTLQIEMQHLFDDAQRLYEKMLDHDVAKECARNVLPLCTPTRMYMKGSCRSWIHYISLRGSNGTQQEHMDIAKEAQCLFAGVFPDVAEAMEWN